MSATGQIVLLIIFLIGVLGFATMVAFIDINHKPADVTINTTQEAYYNASTLVNKTMNSTMEKTNTALFMTTPFPVIIGVCTLAGLLTLFLVVKRR